MIKAMLWSVAAVVMMGAAAKQAAVPGPIAVKGEVVFADDFERSELGKGWMITHPAFSIVGGAMTGSQVKEEHGAVAMIKTGIANGVIAFRFKLGGASSINAVCDDKTYKESHGSHICRVQITATKLFLGDDKERMSHEVEEMKKDPSKKEEVARRTAGRSSTAAVKIGADEWHEMVVEIVDDEMRVSLDGEAVGYLKSSGIAHPTKNEFHFTVSGKDAWFDDVRVWRAQRAGK